MIHVEPRDEPADFDTKVRQPGRKWLANPTNRSKQDTQGYWRACSRDVAEMFKHRCGYLAHRLGRGCGQVDHFVSWKRCKDRDEHHLAYEWTNLRWILPQLNSRKRDHELLDPFDVDDEWFEVDLLSYRLIVHQARIPEPLRGLALRTIRQLDLDQGDLVERWRGEAVELFRAGTSLERLHEEAPLVARAIEKLLREPELFGPAHLRLRDELLRARRAARGGDDFDREA